MKTTIRKRGHSATVRIPAAMLRMGGMEVGEAVQIREEAGHIVIEPLGRKEYNLAELVKGITAKNRHTAI